jgi:hypothetical protein
VFEDVAGCVLEDEHRYIHTTGCQTPKLYICT